LWLLQIEERLRAETEERRRRGKDLSPPSKTTLGGPNFYGLIGDKVPSHKYILM